MALPTKTDVEKMDFSFKGQPFVDVPAKDSIDTTTMDYSYMGSPFITNPAGSTPPPVTGNNNFLIFFN